jgi:hypothetical protein
MEGRVTAFSTTKSSGAPVQACPENCKEALNQIMDEVNKISRMPGPLERNAAITEAYEQLAKDMPENDWVRLASYVSFQAGCAMQQTRRGIADNCITELVFFDADKGLGALGDGNLTIFSSIYPANRMVANCGYEKFKKCVESGEIGFDENVTKALEKMNNGDLKGAAADIAIHEQRDVVQPVYDRWAETFAGIASADWWDFTSDNTSIPIAKTCTRDNLVPLEGNLSNWLDRVSYYRKLMDEMHRVEALGRG